MRNLRTGIEDDLVEFALEISKQGESDPEIIQKSIDTNISRRSENRPFEVRALSKKQRSALAASFNRPTPRGYSSTPLENTDPFSVLQRAIAAEYGQPFRLHDQRNGALIHDVFPTEKNMDRPNSSLGATKLFAWHSDQAYNPNRGNVPAWVSLGCVRNHEGAILKVSPLEEVTTHLTEDEIAILSQPAFEFHKGRPEEALGSCVGSILGEANGKPTIRVGTDMTFSNDQAERAFSALVNGLERSSINVVLAPGEIALFDNTNHVHSRSRFTPHRNLDQRRWLQRLHIASI